MKKKDPLLERDIQLDNSIRPSSFDDFIGQKKLVDNLRVLVEASKKRKEALGHILFLGPPGLGKTTLAHIIAREMNVNITVTSGPAIERQGDLAGILTTLNERDILFIDEIHRLPRPVEEILYPAMEDFAIDIVTGKGPHASSIRLKLPPFTLIGATTRMGLITSPLRDRFSFHAHLDFYTQEEIFRIILRSSKILNLAITEEGALEIASRSRGTPRVANQLLKWVRDFAQVKKDGRIDKSTAREALQAIGIDERGFDSIHRRILETIIIKYGGGPVGLGAISAVLHEEKDTIEEVYEPFLLKEGFIVRTPRGRVATILAYKHLGIEPPGGGKLFHV